MECDLSVIKSENTADNTTRTTAQPQNLASEIVFEIFKNLIEKDLGQTSLVSREWNLLSQHNYFWRPLFDTKFPFIRIPSEQSCKDEYKKQFYIRENLKNGIFDTIQWDQKVEQTNDFFLQTKVIKIRENAFDGLGRVFVLTDQLLKKYDYSGNLISEIKIQVRNLSTRFAFQNMKIFVGIQNNKLYVAREQNIYLFDCSSGNLDIEFPSYHKVISMKIKDNQLFVAYSNRSINIFDLSSGKLLDTVQMPNFKSNNFLIEIFNDKLFLCECSMHGFSVFNLYEYDMNKKEWVWTLKNDIMRARDSIIEITDLRIHHNNLFIKYEADLQDYLRCYDIHTNKEKYSEKGIIDFCIKDGYLFCLTTNSQILIRDLSTDEEIFQLCDNNMIIDFIDYHNGKLLLSGLSEKRILNFVEPSQPQKRRKLES